MGKGDEDGEDGALTNPGVLGDLVGRVGTFGDRLLLPRLLWLESPRNPISNSVAESTAMLCRLPSCAFSFSSG